MSLLGVRGRWSTVGHGRHSRVPEADQLPFSYSQLDLAVPSPIGGCRIALILSFLADLISFK